MVLFDERKLKRKWIFFVLMKERLFEGVLGEMNGVALLSTKLKLRANHV